MDNDIRFRSERLQESDIEVGALGVTAAARDAPMRALALDDDPPPVGSV